VQILTLPLVVEVVPPAREGVRTSTIIITSTIGRGYVCVDEG
jgi:hypothetical protein